MTPVGEILRDEIRRTGPIPFHRFMDAALYHPEHGYYRKARDPFGAHGDFYTAEQVQPVFGILIAERIRMLCDRMGRPEGFALVELGAGRQEMAEAFREFPYRPVDLNSARTAERSAAGMPDHLRGVVFSNEFFDALPVEAAVIRNGQASEMRVGFADDRFIWTEGDRAREELECYRKKYFGHLPEGQVIEINLEALDWLDRIAAVLKAGYVFTIDYGYTAREMVRFPRGTLMSYRRHQAIDDVLKDPGEQDITAHVCFTALEEHGREIGLERESFGTLAQTLIAAGERDQFAGVLAAGSEGESLRRRLQLKQLLTGMGETFRVLVQWKSGEK
ncbi:MAG TPA: SAM-dependent methyltransferase [Bryobacteraceae bacterium]|nr:SAM-dependent methyltransferase [Bryobacteraceae bacterium]